MKAVAVEAAKLEQVHGWQSGGNPEQAARQDRAQTPRADPLPAKKAASIEPRTADLSPTLLQHATAFPSSKPSRRQQHAQ